MSEIYLAHHVVLQKDRIVKIIKPELLNNPKILDLFRREASLLSEIRNEAIVSYEGFFQDDKKRYYLVMEYINGPTLAEVIKQRKLTPDEIYILRDRLIYGLMAAHRKGAIHRDLSPDNIILPQGEIGNAKIIDFGIAKDTNEGTIVGDQFVGKFRFSSPEQLRLIDAPVAAYSDIYSLALVLTAAALGQALDMGNSYVSAGIARKLPPDLGAVPDALRPQLTAMLQPDPAQRPQDLEEILQRWPKPSALADTPTITATAVPVPGFGKKILTAVASVVVIMIAAAGVWFFLLNGPSKPDREVTNGTQTQTDICNQPVEQLVQLSADAMFDCAQSLHSEQQLDKALLLWEQAWNSGKLGAAALARGELYDPALWGSIPSPFTQPNPRQAEKWYKRASAEGITIADERLARMQAWENEQTPAPREQ
jgi:serine/threonine-protein kinase